MVQGNTIVSIRDLVHNKSYRYIAVRRVIHVIDTWYEVDSPTNIDGFRSTVVVVVVVALPCMYEKGIKETTSKILVGECRLLWRLETESTRDITERRTTR